MLLVSISEATVPKLDDEDFTPGKICKPTKNDVKVWENTLTKCKSVCTKYAKLEGGDACCGWDMSSGTGVCKLGVGKDMIDNTNSLSGASLLKDGKTVAGKKEEPEKKDGDDKADSAVTVAITSIAFAATTAMLSA